jgi:dihydroorotate dehydrogenase
VYKLFIRPVLFLINPESIHNLVYTAILKIQRWKLVTKIISKFLLIESPILERTIMGLHFKNPVGIAAGFDKDGRIVDGLACLGFGFVEIGTVTPMPQSGNPRPRLFRLKRDKALINRMGFNNLGVDYTIESLSRRKSDVIVGGNIGKNKITPNEDAIDDYMTCLRKLYNQVDYFTINVSSPNTPGLRELQQKDPLKRLLAALQSENEKKGGKPILLKIAPDLSLEQLNDIIEIIKETGMKGIIATNTTISREGLTEDREKVKKIGDGGLSGEPLFNFTLKTVSYLRQKLGPDFVIIGAGGIMNPEKALKVLDAGANLVQLYTGFIYEGPAVTRRINRHLIRNWKEKQS